MALSLDRFTSPLSTLPHVVTREEGQQPELMLLFSAFGLDRPPLLNVGVIYVLAPFVFLLFCGPT